MDRTNEGKFRWNEFTLRDAEFNKEFDIDSNPVEYTKAMDEFKRTGGIQQVFFAKIGVRGEQDDDASTWGPQSPDDVDWGGFEI